MPPPWALIGRPAVSSHTSPGRNSTTLRNWLSAACSLVSDTNSNRVRIGSAVLMFTVSPLEPAHLRVHNTIIVEILTWGKRRKSARHGHPATGGLGLPVLLVK